MPEPEKGERSVIIYLWQRVWNFENGHNYKRKIIHYVFKFHEQYGIVQITWRKWENEKYIFSELFC